MELSIKDLFEGPVGDYCIARNTIKCLLKKKSVEGRTRDFRIAGIARSPLDQAVTVPHRKRIEYYNILYCLNKRARSQTTFTDCIYES